MECLVCAAERQSRRRVGLADMENVDEDPEWEFAPRAVPNNDLRYEINKLQARRFAQRRNVQLLWCPAKDKVGIEALRTDPSLPAKKSNG